MKNTGATTTKSVAAGPIKAVTFDVGGTLIECWPSVGHIYAEVAAHNGCNLFSADVLNARFAKAWKEFSNFRHTQDDWAELVDKTFLGLTEPPPSQSFFTQLFNRFSEPTAWHIFDDVLPTLELLRSRGVKLGIISNWDDRLRPLLRQLSLETFFQTIVISCEHGIQKPARRLFDSACSALECAPSETLHVGDSFQADFEGAQAAGLQSLWLTRGSAAGAVGAITSLRDLDKI